MCVAGDGFEPSWTEPTVLQTVTAVTGALGVTWANVTTMTVSGALIPRISRVRTRRLTVWLVHAVSVGCKLELSPDDSSYEAMAHDGDGPHTAAGFQSSGECTAGVSRAVS
jgi:hypothetical protein